MTATWPLRLVMVSDWIVGAGRGRVGEVDATVRRDADGLPFVPAGTLVGVWRDACEQAAGMLGSEAWSPWADWLFGSQPDRATDPTAGRGAAPRPGAVGVTDARLSEIQRTAMRDRPALLAAAVSVRPGVRLRPDGTAEDRYLRSEERARPCVLEATLAVRPGALPPDADLPAAAELLLRAGAASLDSLGGKRRRGAGRVWLLPPDEAGSPATIWDGTDLHRAPRPSEARPVDVRLGRLLVDDPSRLDAPGRPPEPPARDPSVDLDVHAPASDAHDRVTYEVTWAAREPVVASPRTRSNVLDGLDHVPGTVLLPAVLRRARADGRRLSPQDVVVGDARPGSPMPRTWLREKRGGTGVVNGWLETDDGHGRKPSRAGHVRTDAVTGRSVSAPAARSVSTHAVVDDTAGRPTESGGGVFSMVGLAPGTELTSRVVLPADARLDLGPGDEVRVGRRRHQGFGLLRVLEVRRVVEEAPAPDARPGLRPGREIPVWCLSDVLLDDEWLAWRPAPEALAAELTRAWDVDVRVVRPEGPGRPLRTEVGVARRDGFHGGWGLARPTLVGLAAGSVVTLVVDASVPAERVTRMERDGVGLRRAEGFGRLRVDADELTTVRRLDLRPAKRHVDPVPAETALPAAPTPVELTAWRAELARRVAALVLAPREGWPRDGSRRPGPAQWGTLRRLLVLPPEGPGTPAAAIRRWLATTGAVPARCRQWGSFLGDLDTLLTAPAEVWRRLADYGGAWDDLVLRGEPDGDAVRVERLQAELWWEAVVTLLTELARARVRDAQDGSTRTDGTREGRT